MSKKLKVAVIGSGLGGISAAYYLKDQFDVTLFEGQDKVGMGIYTADFVSNGVSTRIDIPLRIFTPGYYTHLTKLYKDVGVELEMIDHSAAYADKDNHVFFHYGNIYFGPFSFLYPKLEFKNLRGQFSLLSNIRKFYKNAYRDVAEDKIGIITFGEYLKKYDYSDEFIENILLPPLSATCTCDYASVLGYPAQTLLDYLTCGVLKQGVLKATRGVEDITNRLLSGINIHCSTKAQRITHQGDQVSLDVLHNDTPRSYLFDIIILATPPHLGLEILDSSKHENDMYLKSKLQKIPIEYSEMLLHTDTSILPKSLYSVSPINYFLPDNAKRPEVTVDMSKSTPSIRGIKSIFQTWNPIRTIAKDKVIAREKFSRPIVTVEGQKAVMDLLAFQKTSNHNVLLCGSYMSDKIPLLDAAVESSIEVAKNLARQKR